MSEQITPTLEVGTEVPLLEFTLTRTDLVRYAAASGDFNAIHHSDHAARQVELPGVVAHGMLTLGSSLRAVTDWLGVDRIASIGVRFSKPVVVPDDGIGAHLTVTGSVTEVADDQATIALETRCGDEKVLTAFTVGVRR